MGPICHHHLAVAEQRPIRPHSYCKKKKKLVKEFVDKIELANIAYFEKKKSDKRDKYLELYNAYLTEVADTFDKLYYNTYEAYVEQRYNFDGIEHTNIQTKYTLEVSEAQVVCMYIIVFVWGKNFIYV